MRKYCRAFVLFGTAIMVLGVISLAGVAKGQQVCGPMDVAFLIDDTGSMADDIAAVQAGLTGAGGIIEQLQAASGGDLRLGLITFKDTVEVDSVLTTDIATVQALILGLSASGGNGAPEASDEALNTAVNNLAARAGQTGSFDVLWRTTAIKIIILATDNLPGGFDDAYTPGVDDLNAHNQAVTAATKNILISAIYCGGGNATVEAIMQDYATTTGGIYILATTAEDVADGVAQIISECGGAAKPAVGGYAVPVNKVELLAPWIALASVVSLAGAVAVALKKGKR